MQFAVIGVTLMTAVQLIAVHMYTEAFFRPVRAAIIGGSPIGDSLPRSRPTFATWSIIAITWAFTLVGALLAAVDGRTCEGPAFAS